MNLINELRHLEFISPSGVKVILVREHIKNDLWRTSGEVVLPVVSDLYTCADSLAEAFKEGLENVSVKIVQKEFVRVIIVDLPSTVKGKGLDDDFYFNEEERGIVSKIAKSIAFLTTPHPPEMYVPACFWKSCSKVSTTLC